MKFFNIFLYFILLSVLASASSNITYFVSDINTYSPIVNASIIVMNISNYTLYSDTTNNYGFSFISSDTSEVLISYITKTGYVPYTDISNITEDTFLTLYMTPISVNGFVRMFYDDLTINQHDICIFFSENNRLMGCYNSNSTIQLIINKGYKIVPRIFKSDILTTPEGVKYYSSIYYIPIVSVLFILGLLFGLLCFIIYLWKRK